MEWNVRQIMVEDNRHHFNLDDLNINQADRRWKQFRKRKENFIKIKKKRKENHNETGSIK